MSKNNEQIPTDCTVGVDVQRRVTHLEDSDSKQWDTIERLQNRLPVWATLFIAGLSCLLGSALTYAGLVVKIANIGASG